MTTIEWVLLISALVIISVLAGIAIWMWSQVLKQQKIQRDNQAKIEKMAQEKREYIIESVRVIAANVVDEGLNISEGSIRLKVLIDNLNLPDEEKIHFDAFDKLYEQVKDLDTHQARKQLSKEKRKEQDSLRIRYEKLYEGEVLKAAQKAREFPFEKFAKTLSS